MPIHISPNVACIDVPRSIQMTNIAPGIARLVATMEKPDGSYWSSVALFDVKNSGTIDLDRDPPFSGDWAIADSMAIVWSMRKIRHAGKPEKSPEVEPLTITLSLTDASGAVHRGEFTQNFLAPGVRRQPINHPELVGEVFFPAGNGPHPVVIGLNGSNGGMPLQRCALYAANGYIAVALAFFGAPGRPKYFGDTPLEYFEAAFLWVKEHLKPKDDFIAVAGSSRGGELACILGAFFPEHVHGVVAFVPSAVVNGIQQAGKPGLPRDTPAWFYKGRPLPNLWKGNPDADISAYTTPSAPGLPIRQDAAFISAMRNTKFLEKARIPVEKIKGPIILASAENDGCWPSELFCSMIQERLAAHKHPWKVEHVRNPLAGHSLMFPYLPVNETIVTHPVSGLIMDYGGTSAINAKACRNTWEKIIDFLRNAPDYYKQGTR